jgi:hypothetical protein
MRWPRRSKNYRYSTNHQVVIDTDTQLVVAVGAPLPGNCNDAVAFGKSGVDNAMRNATVIADGGYRGTRAVIPHRRKERTSRWWRGRRSTTLPTAACAPASSTPWPR